MRTDRAIALVLVVLTGLLALPAPASAADEVTFAAPFAGASTSKATRTDGTLLTSASADAQAAAGTGEVVVTSTASNANPAGAGLLVGGAAGTGTGRIELGSFTTSTGAARGVVTVVAASETETEVVAGGASATVEVMLECGENRFCGASIGPIASASSLGAAGRDREEISERTLELPFTINEFGACNPDAAPAELELSVAFAARTQTISLSRAAASATLRLVQVTVQELPCANPEPTASPDV